MSPKVILGYLFHLITNNLKYKCVYVSSKYFLPNLQEHQTTKDTIDTTQQCNTLDSNGKMLSMLSFTLYRTMFLPPTSDIIPDLQRKPNTQNHLVASHCTTLCSKESKNLAFIFTHWLWIGNPHKIGPLQLAQYLRNLQIGLHTMSNKLQGIITTILLQW
jgi:hypothetical protein